MTRPAITAAAVAAALATVVGVLVLLRDPRGRIPSRGRESGKAAAAAMPAAPAVAGDGAATELAREMDAMRRRSGELAAESARIASDLGKAQAAAVTNHPEAAELSARYLQRLAEYKRMLDDLPGAAERRTRLSSLRAELAALTQRTQARRTPARLAQGPLPEAEQKAIAERRAADEQAALLAREAGNITREIEQQRKAARESDPDLKKMKFEVLELQYRLEAAVRGHPDVSQLLARRDALAAEARRIDERMRAWKAEAGQAEIVRPAAAPARPPAPAGARTNGNA